MKQKSNILNQLRVLQTERINKKSEKIDSLEISRILLLINREDRKIARIVKNEIPYIKKGVDLVVKALKSGGRLIYVGTGTSGRLGIVDAAECPPTYGTNPRLIQGIIAGGKKAVFRSQESAEDNIKNGIKEIRAKKISEKDVVCGIAASLRTPYVVAAVGEAKKLGAKTIYITTNPRSLLNKKVFRHLKANIDVAICPDVGPEVIMGSTRMKSGTAQKLILNMITTSAMILLGKVYGNMMVDLKMNNNKLRERAKRVLMIATGADYKTSAKMLKRANGHVKTAIVMIKANVSADRARILLHKSDGFVRLAIMYGIKKNEVFN